MPGRPSATPSILRGIVLVACGRPDGLARFGGTRETFLASLAPLLAFPLVGGALMLAGGAGRAGAAQLLAALCALLAPPVLSFELARFWDRRRAWLRFATAFNWSQWALWPVALIALGGLAPVLTIALDERTALGVAVVAIVCYQFWLHWFLARHGLALSRLRAAALVLIVDLGTALLVLGPVLLIRP